MGPDLVVSSETGSATEHEAVQPSDGFCAGSGRPLAGAGRGASRGGHVGVLAGQVLAVLRGRKGRNAALDPVRLERLGDRIIAAGLADAESALDDLVVCLRREGIDASRLVDEVLPHAARELGRAWEEDRMSFLEVALVMTRLQRVLRDRLMEPLRDGHGLNALFVLPEGEQHTFGGLVAVQQLRRMGHSAVLAIGERPERLGEMLRVRSFDVAFVSVSSWHALDSAREVVACVRRETADALPVVVGGALVCATNAEQTEELRALLGARMVTNELERAMDAVQASKERMRAATA